MAIKVNNITVIGDTRQLSNVDSIDSVTKTSILGGIQADLDVAVASAVATEIAPIEGRVEGLEQFESDLSSQSGSSFVGFKQDGIGAVVRTAQDKMRDVVSVKDFGAVGDGVTDDTAAIQAAIDFAKDAGRMEVLLPPGTYLIAQTISIYTGTILRGAGVNVTFLKAADGSNCGVLETDGFASLTGGTAKFVTDTGMTWGFELRGFTVDGNRQNNYGGVSGTRFGGVGSTVWDGFGIRLYGRRYIIEDVNVQYCAGIGFYSECGNPAVPSPADWYYNALNNQQGHIKGMAITQCSYDGFVFLGPGDIRIDDITAELCFYPDETLYGTARNSLLFPTETICGMVFMSKSANTAVGGAEIGFIHSHTHKNGYGIRFYGESGLIMRIRGENITSEGNLAGIKMHGRITGQVNKVNIRNQNYGDGSLPDFDYENLNSESFVISEYENRASTGNAGSIRLMVRNDHLQIGTVSILGGTAGHGVVLGDNVNFVLIDQLNCRDLRGTAYDGNPSRALWTKTSAAYNYISNVVLIDNDVGWYNENTAENIIANGVISADATRYPSALTVQFAASPSNGALRRCKFISRNRASSLLPDYAGAVAINPAITTEQEVTFTHSMWRTPSINEVDLSYTTNGTTRPTLQYLEVVSVSATQITARIKFSAAGNGTTSGSSLMARVA